MTLGKKEEGGIGVLTAGRAKKETPIKAKVPASRRPAHVFGVLSPYPMVVKVI